MSIGESNGKSSVILVVDDDETNRGLVAAILDSEGYRVEHARDGLEALAKLKLGVDLVLLDLVMPGLDGFEVIRRIRRDESYHDLPVIMITGLSGREQQTAALRAGANDFVGRPFEPVELRVRVEAQLRLRKAAELVKRHDVDLEAAVARRTAQLRASIDEAVAAQREAWQAQLDTVHRLALACDYKDHDTAVHAQRISAYCALLGREIDLDPGEVELIRYASPMHDVGKMGIPDSILLKRGPLSAEERTVMEQHTEIGARILSGSSSRLLQAGEVIALAHHERWDGGGYPRRLAGEAIPLSGRICAVADFFDALTSDRVYRPAVPIDATLDLMRQGRGTHFDPRLLDLFMQLEEQVRAIKAGSQVD